MSRRQLIRGLTFLALAGCVSEPNLPKYVDYAEKREGYFIENGLKNRLVFLSVHKILRKRLPRQITKT